MRTSGERDVVDEQFVHRHRARFELHVLPRPDAGVGALAVDLDRADRGRHLLDLADELRQLASYGIRR